MGPLHDRRLLWAVSAAFGAAAIPFTSFSLLAVVAWVLLLIPWVVRGGHLALSGVLVGFGAPWSLLMWRQLTQGPGDNALGWTLVGVLPLVLGLALLGVDVATTSDSDARRA
jgi:apolipoprotein N-acyltransferase